MNYSYDDDYDADYDNDDDNNDDDYGNYDDINQLMNKGLVNHFLNK